MTDNTFVNDLLRSKSPKGNAAKTDELSAAWITLEQRLEKLLDGIESLAQASHALPEGDPASDNLRDAIIDLGDQQEGVVWAVEDLEVLLGLDEGDDLLEPDDPEEDL